MSCLLLAAEGGLPGVACGRMCGGACARAGELLSGPACQTCSPGDSPATHGLVWGLHWLCPNPFCVGGSPYRAVVSSGTPAATALASGGPPALWSERRPWSLGAGHAPRRLQLPPPTPAGPTFQAEDRGPEAGPHSEHQVPRLSTVRVTECSHLHDLQAPPLGLWASLC